MEDRSTLKGSKFIQVQKISQKTEIGRTNQHPQVNFQKILYPKGNIIKYKFGLKTYTNIHLAQLKHTCEYRNMSNGTIRVKVR